MDERFTTKMEDINFIDSEGNKISYEELKPKQQISDNTQYKVGDLVIIKKTNDVVKILYVDYNVTEAYHFDYAGQFVNKENEGLTLINQKDILGPYLEETMKR